MILTALGQNRIESKRATTMLYALQVAASNAPNVSRNEPCVVRETLFDESGTLLSPDEDPEEVRDAQLFLAEIEKEIAAEENELNDEDGDD